MASGENFEGKFDKMILKENPWKTVFDEYVCVFSFEGMCDKKSADHL